MQSSAILYLAETDPEIPTPDVAIFADTGDEPEWVNRQVEDLKRRSRIPIRVVRKHDTSLSEDVIARHNGMASRFATIPAFASDENGEPAPLRRQCTREYKVEPIEREVRRLLGYAPRKHVKHRVDCMIGISFDEMDCPRFLYQGL